MEEKWNEHYVNIWTFGLKGGQGSERNEVKRASLGPTRQKPISLRIHRRTNLQARIGLLSSQEKFLVQL